MAGATCGTPIDGPPEINAPNSEASPHTGTGAHRIPAHSPDQGISRSGSKTFELTMRVDIVTSWHVAACGPRRADPARARLWAGQSVRIRCRCCIKSSSLMVFHDILDVEYWLGFHVRYADRAAARNHG
jgi:hypothetical protein